MAASKFNTLCVATKDTLRLIANLPSQIIKDWRLVSTTPALRDSADALGFVGFVQMGAFALFVSAPQTMPHIILSTAFVIGSVLKDMPDLLEKGLSMYPPFDVTKLALISANGLAFSLAAQHGIAKSHRQRQAAPSAV